MKHQLIKEIQKEAYREIHLQIIPETNETPETFAEKIAQTLKKHHASVIRATFFGNLNKKESTIIQFEEKLSGIEFPISWIEGENCGEAFINGVYILAVSGTGIKRLYSNSIPVGSVIKTNAATFCYFGGLYSDPGLSPAEQAENTLNITENLLKKAGLAFEDTIRTWFYLDDILDWYGDFNRVRTAFFERHDIFNKRVPASTGIEGSNPENSKVCLELNAIKPENEKLRIERLKSPLQCSAEDYGSSFSRAMWFSDGEHQYITVSGTASIGPDGKIFHKNDLTKQIELTFRVVKEILNSRGFSFENAVRAYAYCKDKNYSKLFYDYLKTSGLADKLSFICSGNKVCWEDLLFEIELDVVKKI
jgi:enamine deaminase RidA (YjgF/YER057c/UK114 family)